MYSLIKYFTSPKTNNNSDKPNKTTETTTSNNNRNRKQKQNTVFLVINKNNHYPLGIFDTLEKAKQNGQKTTHYNCTIIPFQVNEPCKYLFNPIYEDS